MSTVTGSPTVQLFGRPLAIHQLSLLGKSLEMLLAAEVTCILRLAVDGDFAQRAFVRLPTLEACEPSFPVA